MTHCCNFLLFIESKELPRDERAESKGCWLGKGGITWFRNEEILKSNARWFPLLNPRGVITKVSHQTLRCSIPWMVLLQERILLAKRMDHWTSHGSAYSSSSEGELGGVGRSWLRTGERVWCGEKRRPIGDKDSLRQCSPGSRLVWRMGVTA